MHTNGISPNVRLMAALMAVVVVVAFIAPELAAAQGTQVLLEADGLFQLAKLKMKEKKFAEAEGYLRKIVGLTFPNEPKAQRVLAGSYVVLVDALYRQHKWDEGLKEGLAGLRVPGLKTPCVFAAELLKLIGQCYEKKGNADKAAEYLERSVKMHASLAKANKR